MTNREIAAVLFNISTILSAQRGNPYRIRAYRRAARNILRMRGSIAARVAAGKPLGLPRLGKSLTVKISTLASEGRLAFYEQLCAELPAVQQTLLKVPGLGPTIAARIDRDLGAADADSLRRAATTGALQRVWGIGPKRTAAILDTLGGQYVRQERMEI
jgi:DNA polymerase/3'-5' exonuclease PolX